MSYLGNAAAFLIQTLFGLYILIVMLRFLLQWVRADFHNPLVQFIVRASNPVLLPLRRVIPGFMKLDMAALCLAFGLQLLEQLLLLALFNQRFTIAGWLVLSLAQFLSLIIGLYSWSVIISAIASWFNTNPYHPVLRLLGQLTAPLLRPAARIAPAVSGIDLSPLVVIIALQLLQLVPVAWLFDLGQHLLRL